METSLRASDVTSCLAIRRSGILDAVQTRPRKIQGRTLCLSRLAHCTSSREILSVRNTKPTTSSRLSVVYKTVKLWFTKRYANQNSSRRFHGCQPRVAPSMLASLDFWSRSGDMLRTFIGDQLWPISRPRCPVYLRFLIQKGALVRIKLLIKSTDLRRFIGAVHSRTRGTEIRGRAIIMVYGLVVSGSSPLLLKNLGHATVFIETERGLKEE